ncbi:MAG: GntR family transcriptional regulator [Nitratireductor sp.]|nr:GntR family transcriptional regulator [Nitratireductor sp.]
MDQRADNSTKRIGTALLAADVHRALRAKIVSLEYKAGSRLVEDDISREIGVGRTPVREALLRLEGEGLVSRERRGWIIEATDPANARYIFEARISVESYATRVTAKRGDAKSIETLRKLVARMDDLDSISRSELNRLDRRFHEMLVAMSGNPIFVEMHERTQFHYWNLRLPVLFNKEQTLNSNEQHKAILAAVEAGDCDAAERLAREHIEATFAIVRQALDGF